MRSPKHPDSNGLRGPLKDVRLAQSTRLCNDPVEAGAYASGEHPVSTRGGVLRDQAALACNLVACQCQGNNSATRLAG